MAPAQMALPVDRRNGASAPRRAISPPRSEPPAQPPTVDGGGQPLEVDGAPPVPVWVRGVTTTSVVVVALVAALASYEHMRLLALIAGEGWRSWLLPLSVDGLAVAASMTMFVRRRAGLPAGGLAWLALLLGLGASLAANVAAADPTVQGRLVAAWPPLGLLLAYELLVQQVKALSGPGVETVRSASRTPRMEVGGNGKHR
jgi:Protein of unknown function (DUF2637)